MRLKKLSRTVEYSTLPFESEEVLEKFENYLNFEYKDNKIKVLALNFTGKLQQRRKQTV